MLMGFNRWHNRGMERGANIKVLVQVNCRASKQSLHTSNDYYMKEQEKLIHVLFPFSECPGEFGPSVYVSLKKTSPK